MWDISTGAVATLRGRLQGINAIVISQDGWTMATHSDDWTIKFWNVEAGQEMLTFAARKAYCDTPWLFFSPDGRTLAMGSVDGGLFTRLWHALRPEEANPGKQGSPELPIRWQSRLMPSDAGGRRRIPSPVNVVLEWLPI